MSLKTSMTSDKTSALRILRGAGSCSVAQAKASCISHCGITVGEDSNFSQKNCHAARDKPARRFSASVITGFRANVSVGPVRVMIPSLLGLPERGIYQSLHCFSSSDQRGLRSSFPDPMHIMDGVWPDVP